MPSPLNRYARTQFRLLDLVCVAYSVLIAGLLVLFHDTVPDWAPRLLVHLLIAAGIIEMVRVSERRATAHRGWRYLRTLYPLVLLLVGWGELNAIVSMLYGGSFWMTDLVVGWDQLLFGGHPTVLVQALHHPWLDELMAIMYNSYYLFLAVPLVLLARRKDEAALASSSVIALTYATTFILFMLLPTKSPAHVLAEYPGLRPSAYTGYVIAALTRSIQTSESVIGAAFPSSHVAGAFVCALLARRYFPALGKLLIPLAFGVSIATVYLGYHHALDPITGLVWGGFCYAIGLRWIRARGEDPLAHAVDPVPDLDAAGRDRRHDVVLQPAVSPAVMADRGRGSVRGDKRSPDDRSPRPKV